MSCFSRNSKPSVESEKNSLQKESDTASFLGCLKLLPRGGGLESLWMRAWLPGSNMARAFGVSGGKALIINVTWGLG